MEETGDLYRRRPDDAVQGGLLVVADLDGVTLALQRVCDAFAEDGYDTVACPTADVSAILASLPAPRFLVGFGAGGAAVLAAAGEAAAVSAFYPTGIDAYVAETPLILHYAKSGRGEAAAVRALAETNPKLPVFVYPAADGFYDAGGVDYDAGSARLARLRTLALFRRTASRGEA